MNRRAFLRLPIIGAIALRLPSVKAEGVKGESLDASNGRLFYPSVLAYNESGHVVWSNTVEMYRYDPGSVTIINAATNQTIETGADRDLAEGRYRIFDTIEEFIASLDDDID